MNPSKQQVLETISSIGKIIMLAFKPLGTKIAIRNHILVLCESDLNSNGVTRSYIGFYQGIERYCYGDSRDDLYILNHVLTNFIDLYILTYPKDSAIYKGLIMMCRYMCCGLKRLQQTYVEGNATCVIQYMINILYTLINDTYKPYMMYSINRINRSNLSIYGNSDTKETMDHSSIFDTNKIKDFWSQSELKSIIGQFNQCFTHDCDDQDQLQYQLQDQVNQSNEPDQSIDQKDVYEEVSVNNSYKDNGLPIPKNPSNALVSGYLVGINQILIAMDNRFIIMLERSVKGKK